MASDRQPGQAQPVTTRNTSGGSYYTYDRDSGRGEHTLYRGSLKSDGSLGSARDIRQSRRQRRSSGRS